jgi:hypothetical protein
MGNQANPWALEREREQAELAVDVVRAERSMARQRARDAMRSRVFAARCADLIAVCALFVPWAHVPDLDLGYGAHLTAHTYDGVRLPWVLGLGLIATVVRQVALTTAFAQPDRRLSSVLYGAATLAMLANITVVVGLPLTVAPMHADSISLFGPIAFGAVAIVASVWTFVAGWRMSRAFVPPNLLAGMRLAAPEQVSDRLRGLTATTIMRIRGAVVDRPCVRILGGAAVACLSVAVVGTLAWRQFLGPLLPTLFGFALAFGLLILSALYEAARRERLPRTALVDAYVRLGDALRPPDQPFYVYV